MKVKICLVLLLCVVLLVPQSRASEPLEVGVHPEIASKYEAFFPPAVIKVTEGVFLARGYNRSNPALIEGENGLIVVDPGESIQAAQAVKNAFNEHLDNIFDKKPVKAIIYTHHHDCHIHGALVFADATTEIIAHEKLMESLFDEWYGQIYPSRVEGGLKMTGIMFQHIPGWYAGYILAGPQLVGKSGFIPPTRTVKDELEIQIAGVNLKLFSAPAESRDVIIVWLPDKKVIIQIGIIYESFPALVTMRGSGQRNPLDYLNSLKRMRSLNAEYLVALHGPNPVTAGNQNVYQFLTDFSDAIQFVHDQTVQYINKGLAPGEIIDLIELPPNLADSPYLKETYGSIEWNVYHIFRYYRGYYTGKIRDLFPQSPISQAQRTAELAGGIDALAAKAQGALESGRAEWALELADNVLLLDPENISGFETKNKAILYLAETTMNAQARNMLLSDYLLSFEHNQATWPFGKPTRIYSLMDENAVRLMPMNTALRIMSVSLNASKTMGEDMAVILLLTDVRNDSFYHILHVRNGILEVNPPSLSNFEFVIITDSMTWKRIVLGKLDPQTAISSGMVGIAGASDQGFYDFVDLFYCE